MNDSIRARRLLGAQANPEDPSQVTVSQPSDALAGLLPAIRAARPSPTQALLTV